MLNRPWHSQMQNRQATNKETTQFVLSGKKAKINDKGLKIVTSNKKSQSSA